MATNSVTRVLVADDHPIYREGLVAAIRKTSDLQVIAECADGSTALRRVLDLAPDVSVIDQRMPGLNADEILERLADAGHPARVIVLSALTDAETVGRTIEAGAAGYLAKDSTRGTICEAIRRVAAGGTVIGTEVQAGLASHVRATRARTRGGLSERELEILALLAEGKTSGQMADQLFLSPATVKTHLHSLYEKLGVPGAAAAVAEGMRRGLVR